MTNSAPLHTASLYYTDGKSDKEYHLQVVIRDGGYWVEAQYGRRGGTLQSTTKNKKSLTLDKAKSEFDSVIKEKVSKGYTMDTNGVLFSTAAQGVFTGHVPQLLNAVEQDSVVSLLEDDAWMLQEKFDGHRRMMEQLDSGTYRSINRKGLEVGMPKTTLDGLMKLCIDSNTRLDGELIGDVFWVFDVLELAGKDQRSLSAEQRIQVVTKLIGVGNEHVRIVQTASNTEYKKALYAKVVNDGGEGVVFKRKDSPYVPGRPNSGGTQLKFKFYATATFIVKGHKDAKNSVELGLYDVSRSLGFVTIPANFNIPIIGSLVEVRYLYAYPNGALAQPCYLGVRDDIDRQSCVEAQLKLKSVVEDSDEE